MARPSGYSPELADRILDAVADGATLSAAATACDVKRQTVRGWLDHDPAFASAFEAACKVRVEVLAEQIEARANQAQQIASDAAKAGENPNAAIAGLRVELENKRWLLAKLAPATYGDHNRVEMTGKDGAPLIPVETDTSKLALALLVVLHGGDAGHAAAASKVAQPAMAARATTTLLSPLVEPVEPEPVPVSAEPEQTEAVKREHRRWVALTGPRGFQVFE